MTTNSSFLIEYQSKVRGCHVYKDNWESVDREELQCIRDWGNLHNPNASMLCTCGDTQGLIFMCINLHSRKVPHQNYEIYVL